MKFCYIHLRRNYVVLIVLDRDNYLLIKGSAYIIIVRPCGVSQPYRWMHKFLLNISTMYQLHGAKQKTVVLIPP